LKIVLFLASILHRDYRGIVQGL